MAFNLFSVILSIIHAVYSIYVFARRLLLSAKQHFEDVYIGQTNLKHDIEYVSGEVTHLSKVPNHLVIIIGRENLSVADFVNITLWSRAAGISFVTFYDYTGQIKNSKVLLDKALSGASDLTSHPKRNGYKNGHTPKTMPQVAFLDISDGKGGIVRVTRRMCEQARAGKLLPKEVALEYVDELITKESGVPEPELAIYFGDVCSTYGFLPWHIRVTEILPLQNHHKVKAKHFISVLRRYNRCEQRLGK